MQQKPQNYCKKTRFPAGISDSSIGASGRACAETEPAECQHPYTDLARSGGPEPASSAEEQKRETQVLSDSTVHVALVDTMTDETQRLADRYVRYLSDEEKSRFQEYRYPQRRHEYLVTRALIRTELSRYSETRPEEWKFTTNSHGRPELDRHQEAAWLRFNLSHTIGLVACAVARNCDVGIDVEEVSYKHVELIDLAERVFSQEEINVLYALPSELRKARFFEYWTLKEAYVKAKGAGLNIPLNSFAFDFDPGLPIRIRFKAGADDTEGAWKFHLSRPTASHQLALAIRCHGGGDVAIRSAWVTPQ